MQANDRFLLTPEDKEILAELMDGGMDTSDKRGFVMEALTDLRAMESAGEESAMRIIEKMAYDGLFKDLNQRASRKTGIFKDIETGRILNVPQRGSIRVIHADGVASKERQLMLWQEMTRAEFDEWARTQIHLAESLRFKARGIKRVQSAWEQFPEADSAGEACRMAGIDPDALELEQAV